MIELSRYVEPLRKDENFILYRGRSKYDASQILVLSPLAECPAPEILKRLAHEYSLREELDPTWVARPIAMARHWDRTVLVLEDPGGVPLDQLLGHPSDLVFSLRLALGLSSAIERTPRGERVLREIEPIMRRPQAIVRDEEFTPAQSQERFRVAMSDHGSTVLLPVLLQHLRKEAPQSELVVSATSQDTRQRDRLLVISRLVSNSVIESAYR